MGSAKDFSSMLSFYEKHRLQPVIDSVFALNKIEDAHRYYMENGNQFGKIVLQIP
ncbi:zinc-binding dehydrogenase [Shouchella shacheensis]|uniref:zinc-binding dehydrogenase n=1 Tax=Shouchella shacheensis TaxID=1649580 RepID=UPI0009E851B5